MNTSIDAGNTLVKIGFFEKNRLIESIAFPSDPINGFYKHLSGRELGKCILSSVIDIPDHVTSYLRSKSKKLVILDEETPLPIANRYKSPKTLGRDRIALACAGALMYPGQNCLIVSAGTCFTYNLVNKDGKFLGGAISPGLQMRLTAMHDYSAHLPLVELTDDVPLIGTNTVQSILSGAVNGAVSEIETYFRTAQQKYNGLVLLLCGGDSRYLHNKLTIEARLEPDLVLYGLNYILNYVHASRKA